MGRSVFDRAYEVAAAVLSRAPRDGLAHPFGFDEHPPYRWRVSRDVWDALYDAANMVGERDPRPSDRLLGEPLTVDPGLPTNSMLLEPASPDPSLTRTETA